MHTLHYIAVEAQDMEEAFSDVQAFLEPSEETGFRNCDWSDWHVVGGGRWSESQYEDSSNMIISYAEKPEEFNKIIDGIVKYRIENANQYLTKIKLDKFTSDIVEYISNSGELPDDSRFDFNNYYINTMCRLMSGEWIPDSAFFDKKEYTADLRYLRERLDKPETAMLQFLVPVDFHF
jgi:hypothetical protein